MVIFIGVPTTTTGDVLTSSTLWSVFVSLSAAWVLVVQGTLVCRQTMPKFVDMKHKLMPYLYGVNSFCTAEQNR